VLERIPEKMDPRLYYKTFRPYIRFFEHVVYEGVTRGPIDFRGETGAQSSIMPALIAFLKIPHRPSPLMDHLADMRNYMPAPHRAVLDELAALPPVRDLAERSIFNGLLDAIATFHETHFGWARRYPPGQGRRPARHGRHTVHAMAHSTDR
jgi:indoleamine 2,3-dioxygenase